MGILVILAIVFIVWGFLGYNSLRKKWARVIGVGGSYLILLGVMCVVMLISGLVRKLGGGSTGADSAVDIILPIIFALVAIAYTVVVMLTRCETVAQRIMLPFVACLIAGGFCFRALASLVFHLPMENGQSEEFTFPQFLYDEAENPWELLNSGADNANYYCRKTGETRMFYQSDFDLGSPSGFHRR